MGGDRVDGQCEASGFCSFADSECGPAGRRFGKLSGDLSEQCVGVAQGDAGNQTAMDAARIDAALADAAKVVPDAPPPSNAAQFVFSTCGKSGREGPTQAQCDAAYAGTSLENRVTVGADGIQRWTVSQGAVYRVRSAGAGNDSDDLFIQGALIEGHLQIPVGTELRILVGQQASSERGGNGGSFVTLTDNTPLVIAGGAGGKRTFVDERNRASTSTAGQNVLCGNQIANGGTDGGGGEALGGGGCSGAGGGFLSNGQGCGGGFAFVNGGQGGSASNEGGFGGAGSVSSGSSPGGGGGYSGGAVHYTGGGSSCAGGGGSFLSDIATNAATSDGKYDGSSTFAGDPILLLDDWNIGAGSVVFTKLDM